jgi:hypothetical protein
LLDSFRRVSIYWLGVGGRSRGFLLFQARAFHRGGDDGALAFLLGGVGVGGRVERFDRRHLGAGLGGEARVVLVLLAFEAQRAEVVPLARGVGVGLASQPVVSVTGYMTMQSTGQGWTHKSQPVHRSGTTVCISFAAPTMASTGQAWMHKVQPMHSASSM